jgi:hypothetical protein
MSRATELAEQHKGRADDCGELARVILADRERQAGEAVAWADRLNDLVDEFGSETSTETYHGGHFCHRSPSVIREEIRTILASLPAPQAVQAGWKLVPVEPTDEMIEAAWESDGVDYVGEHKRIWQVGPAYAAMLAAAPSPDGKAEQAEAPSGQSLPTAMKTVLKAIQADPDYAWSWHCNVAMAFVDAGGDHYTANQGAARFMRILANVEPAHELPVATHSTASNAGEREALQRLTNAVAHHLGIGTQTTHLKGFSYSEQVRKELHAAYAEASAALASKPPAGEQKPVATWMGTDYAAHMQCFAELAHLEPGTDLYIAPVQPEQVAQDSEPLTKKEIVDLTSMIWGAPCDSDYIAGVITPVVRLVEKLRRKGQRPVDPATLPRGKKGGV